ncbi:MAG: DUF370 domain-containing protein [Oscillospiraceae bacterium]|nr:DUF370 domain-containing protein [Oscillospiraceae bacterium]
MYIHIGQDTVLREESIIGIFDMDNATSSYLTREYLARKEKEKKITAVGSELPRSFTVTSDNGEDAVYLSILSSSTLGRRAESPRIE